MRGWGPRLRRLVRNLQALQLRDAVLQLQLAPLQPFRLQLVLAIGGHPGDLFIQHAVFGAQGDEAFDDLGGAVGIHSLRAYTAPMTIGRGRPRAAAGAGPKPVEWQP